MFAIAKIGKNKVKCKRRKLNLLCKVLEEQKIICLYLSKEERDNKEFRKNLKPYYKNAKANCYQVAVFLSGNHDLTDSMLNLLRYNRDLMARNEVRKEMQTG